MENKQYGINSLVVSYGRSEQLLSGLELNKIQGSYFFMASKDKSKSSCWCI